MSLEEKRNIKYNHIFYNILHNKIYNIVGTHH